MLEITNLNNYSNYIKNCFFNIDDVKERRLKQNDTKNALHTHIQSNKKYIINVKNSNILIIISLIILIKV